MIFKATTLKCTNSGSTWEAKGARQGRYQDNTRYTGVMYFDAIRTVDWTEQDISEIKINLYFDKVGNNSKKNIGLYRGAKDSISGTGAGMRGASIGSFKTNGIAYWSATYGTVTNVFSPSSSSAIFNALVSWLKEDTTSTLVTYKGDDAGDPYSSNYLSITGASLDITYVPIGSGGTLDSSSVEAGSAITLTVEPLEDAVGVLTHSVKWQFGSNTAEQSLAAGVLTAEQTIPLEWLDAIPSAMSGTATCTLTTYEDGVETGSRALEFTITVPDSAAPTFTASPKPVSGKNAAIAGYYQYIGQAVLSITDEDAKYGAEIVAYSISGGEGEAGTGTSLTTGYFNSSGEHSYTLTVTDSRGMTTTKMVEVDVIAVAVPQITEFSVQRYSAVTDGETTQYVATDYGEYVWITAQGTWDTAGGNNSVTAYIEYYPVGSTAKATTLVNLSAANGTLNYSNNRTLISAAIPTASAYAFELYLGDLANSASAADSVAKGRCNVHYAGSGYGVGFGGFAKGTEENPMLESWYPGYFYEGINGVNIYSSGEIDTGGRWIDGKRIYRAIISGSVPAKTTTQIGAIAADADTVVRIDGMFRSTASGAHIPMPYYYNNDPYVLFVEADGGVKAHGHAEGTVFAIIYYTKEEE